MYKIIPLGLFVHQIEYEHNYNTVLYGLPIVYNFKMCFNKNKYKLYKKFLK